VCTFAEKFTRLEWRGVKDEQKEKLYGVLFSEVVVVVVVAAAVAVAVAAAAAVVVVEVIVVEEAAAAAVVVVRCNFQCVSVW
jgi:hypothetical protein